MHWTKAYTRSVIEPQSSPFRLFPRHFQTFLTPESLDSLMIHMPSFPLEQHGDPAIPISPILTCQPRDAFSETLCRFVYLRWLSLGRSGLSQHLTDTAFRMTTILLQLLDCPTLLGRAQKFPRAASFKIELSIVRSATTFRNR
jgi:hypothetical protein